MSPGENANISKHAISFTKISTPYGRIFLEFIANDLPLFFRKNTLKNRVRASPIYS